MGHAIGGHIQNDIGMLSMDGDREIKWLLDSKFNETFPQLSPNGKWIAYVSDESGQNQIYVRPFPDVNRDLTPAAHWTGHPAKRPA